MYVYAVEHQLSELFWTTRHPDMQEVRINEFFFENRQHWHFDCYYLQYEPASKPFDHA